ncbi:MAG TPA: helix-turn-helix domain-containing protein [Pyrinomonadaceae bacterium]|nr:helix-turn-helix domain-containing protein [Pyrinomonadaceae bacterium]
MPENRLLAALPARERERLTPFLEPVSLKFNQVLVEFERPIEYVYFLDTAVTSTVVRTPDGDTIAVGLMGAEGFVGLSLVHGVERSSGTVVVQQEYLALMLGARRPTVTEIAQKLRQSGLLSYTRGSVLVTDRPGLEECACDCYELMEREMDRIFDAPWRDLVRE